MQSVVGSLSSTHDDPYPSNIHLTAEEKTYLCSHIYPHHLLTALPDFCSPVATDLIGFSTLHMPSASSKTIKFDTACSYSMSNDPSRLQSPVPPPNHIIMVKGFNNTTGPATAFGLNIDSRPELYVPGMPKDLVVLLCAADYNTNSGAIILFPTKGFVISL
jgi:hypothetical protein